MVVEGLTTITGGQTLRVREVWADNLEQEMELVRQVVDEYNYIAFDTGTTNLIDDDPIYPI